MPFSELYILVEGDDDERLFNAIFKPLLEVHYDWIRIVRYAQRKPQWVTKLLRSIQQMDSVAYLFVADMNGSPCITRRKEQLCTKYDGVEAENIRIVRHEIEGWYFAGLDSIRLRKLRIGFREATTDNLDKEQFDRLIPRRFDSRVNFMIEILSEYSVDEAVQRNMSLRYFLTKEDCI